MNERRAAFALPIAIAALWLVPHRAVDFSATLGIYLTVTGGWLYVVRGILDGRYRPGFFEAFGIAVAMRVIVIPLAPELSDDIYRYLFEGRVVLHGLNPYVHAPIAAEVAHLRDGFWELINNKSIPAAYPPAVQLVNAAGAFAFGSPLGIKFAYALCDLAAFVLLWRLLPRLGVAAERAVIYGFCPLLVVEFAIEGHSDSFAVAAIVAVLLCVRTARPGAAGAMLGLATAGKLMPVVFLPFVMRAVGRPLRVGVAFVAVVLGLWLPFIVGGESVFEGTMQYVTRWRSNDSMFALIWAGVQCVHDTGWFGSFPVQSVAKVPLALLAVTVLAVAWFRRLPPERACAWFFVFFVTCAPTLHPWYVAFLVPFLCVAPNPGMLAFTGSVFLAYHVLPGWITERRWEENAWVKVVEYAPFYAGLWLASRGISRDVTQQTPRLS